MDVRYHRGELFPDTRPYETGLLDVGDGHVIYWEQSGNPRGVPVLFLHGGPGAGASPIHRRFFDPRFYRIIIIDQRGCGRSRPYAATQANTTAHLVRDIETLRIRLRVRRWLLFGGSWGSTLALAYGQRFPDACAGFILRGVFLGTRREIDWFLTGMGQFFPEAHRAFRDFLDEDERDDILAGYHRRLMSPSPAIHGPAAAAWSRYESACSNLIPRTDEQPARNDDVSALALARLEAHYFVHDVFLEDALLDGMSRLGHVPAIIVQGRYDMVCPVATAEALARTWPAAEFVIVPDAGHSALEPGIRAALVRATEAMKRRDRLGTSWHV